MEHAMFAAAEPLCREQDVARRVARDPASDDVDVRLFAGLEHAEVGVDGAKVGDCLLYTSRCV